MTANTEATRLSPRAIHPLHTLDPDAPLDDLTWLDDVIGGARVVAIGESAHYNREFLQLRHRVLRYLIERHGFRAFAMETGYVEGHRVDAWIHGEGEDKEIGQVMAGGLTSLMGLWTEVRAQLEYLRGRQDVSFTGVDLSGSNASLLPGLDAVIAFLAQADPDYAVDPSLRETAATFAAQSPFAIYTAFGAYGELAQGRKDALTAGLTGLAERVHGRRLDYVQRTTQEAYDRALRAARLTVTLDSVARAMSQGDQQSVLFNRDAAMADTMEALLRREPKVVLAAHNAHLQRLPATLPGMPPATPLGLHLADRLGDAYQVIGTTSGTGETLTDNVADFLAGKLFKELPAPGPATLDGTMAATHDGPFGVDLHRLPTSDEATLRGITQQRLGTTNHSYRPLEAFDALIHLPHVTPATLDPDALLAGPDDVRTLLGNG
ncbi:erythromycin esterase family protein [Flindersiella endophytica]